MSIWLLGDRCMGMGALSPECGKGSEGTISSPWEHGDGSMGMRVWDESM